MEIFQDSLFSKKKLKLTVTYKLVNVFVLMNSYQVDKQSRGMVAQ